MVKRLQAISKNSDQLSFVVLLALLVTSRLFALTEFGFRYVGSDDLVYWQGAVDYSNGIFHEPYFYGQNYNFMIDALFSVPLTLFGTPLYIALPLVSSFIGIFPFLLFSCILYQRGHLTSALVFLLIPITLPVEYDLITSVSRGFTSGLFFASFLIFPLLKPNSTRSFIIMGLAVSMGYITNPNSLVLSFPVCVYLLLENYRSLKFYIIPAAAGLPALLIKFLAGNFYENNPEYLVHFMWNLEYSLDTLVAGFGYLDKFFRYLFPVLWLGNWIVVLLIFLLGIALLKKKRNAALSLILGVVFIFATLGFNKVNDDLGVIFLSSTRMFLAVPLLLGISLFFIRQKLESVKQIKPILLTIGLSVFMVKISSYPRVIAQHTQQTNYGSIAVKEINSLTDECNDLKLITEKYEVDLIVFLPREAMNVPDIEFYNYGCSALHPSPPKSVMNVYERRTWVFEEEKGKARRNVLIFNIDLKAMESLEKTSSYMVLQENPNILLIKNNNKTLEELSKLFNFPLRRNSY